MKNKTIYKSLQEYFKNTPKEEDFELVSIGEEAVKLAIPMIQDREEIKQETLKLKINYENRIRRSCQKVC